jgi:hypothetical protein
LAGCASEEKKQQWREEAAAERVRQSTLTPGEKCIERADNEEKSCNFYCATQFYTNAEKLMYCEGQCLKSKMTRYQMCTVR